MLVDELVVAAQAAAEAAGTATTGGVLAGTAPAMAIAPPMGSDPVSIAIAAAIGAHAAQFTAQTGIGIAERARWAAQIGVSGVVYGASNALTQVSLAL